MAACSKKKLIPPYVQTIKIKGKTPDLCVEKQHLYKRAPTDAKVSRFGSQSFQVADLARSNTCVFATLGTILVKKHSPSLYQVGLKRSAPMHLSERSS
jgi:hypothetical protein